MTTSRQWLALSVAFILVLLGTSALLPIPWFGGKTVLEEVSPTNNQERTYHFITTEFKTTAGDNTIHVYRWNPGSIIVHQGESVRLVLHGIQGTEHQWSLPEFNLSGTIKKGQTSTANFVASRPGTYELICHNHHHAKDSGPMVAYITVLPQYEP